MPEFVRVGLIGIGGQGPDGRIRRGIVRYARPDRPWLLVDAAHDRSLLHRVTPSTVDGIIAHVTDQALADHLHEFGLPVINLSSLISDPAFVHIAVRAKDVGSQAAEAFMSRGLRHFACYSATQRPWELPRVEGYVDRVKAEGHTPHVLDWPMIDPRIEATERSKKQLAIIHEWLLGLPKPVGLYAAGDPIGVDLINACRRIGVAVPDDIAVIGVGDDDLLCETCYPPLSSVILPAERIGHAAAEMIERLIKGEPKPDGPILFPPEGITHRLSSDVFAVDDAKLRQALRYIDVHAADRISVDDIAKAIRINRRDLERRFRKHLDRTPLEEIQRAQVERAKRELLRGNDPMEMVAARAGFRDGNHLAVVFRRVLGKTPTQFRKDNRAT